MLGSFNTALTGYQRKIGAYDKHTWERTLEERVLQGLHRYAAPKKVTQVNTDLLDLDLIRGSPFTKRKPQQGWLASICTATFRVLCMPLCIEWWREQSNGNGYLTGFFLFLYTLQALAMYVYFQCMDLPDQHEGDTSLEERIPSSEVITPLVMMVVLAILQTQIAAAGTGANSANAGSQYSSGCIDPLKRKRSTSNGTIPSLFSDKSGSIVSNLRRSPQRSSYSTTVKSSSEISTVRAYRAGSIGMRCNSISANNSSTHLNNNNNNVTSSPSKTTLRNRASYRRRIKGERNTPSVVESVLETPRPESRPEAVRQRKKGSDEESGFDSVDLAGNSVRISQSESISSGNAQQQERKLSLSERRGVTRESLTINLNRIPLIEVTHSNRARGEDAESSSADGGRSASPDDDQSSVHDGASSHAGMLDEDSSHSRTSVNASNDKKLLADGSGWIRRHSDISNDKQPLGTVDYLVDDRRFSDDSVIRSGGMALNRQEHAVTDVSAEEIPSHARVRAQSCNSPPLARPLDKTKNRLAANTDGVVSDTQCLLTPPPVTANRLLTQRLNASGKANQRSSRSHARCGKGKTASYHKVVRRRVHKCTHRTSSECESDDEMDVMEDNEGTISPTTPTKMMAASDLDWPMMNSDENSSEEGDVYEEEDSEHHHTHHRHQHHRKDTAVSIQKVRQHSVQAIDALPDLISSKMEASETSDLNKSSTNLTQAGKTPPTHNYYFEGVRFSEDIPHPIFTLPEYAMNGVGDELSPDLKCFSTATSPLAQSSGDQSTRTVPTSNTVSCAIWQQTECQKVDLTVLDISSAIVRKVDLSKHSNEYLYVGFVCSLILTIIPGLYRMKMGNFSSNLTLSSTDSSSTSSAAMRTPHTPLLLNGSEIFVEILPNLTFDIIVESFFGTHWKEHFVMGVAMFERFSLALIFFFLICVAEKTFRQRFLIAKYFCHLTSSRRAKRSDLPHFRLNKVRNIKSWLSIRSYLKKHGPQRSVDVIVSGSFMLAIAILTFVCLQLLRDEEASEEDGSPKHFNRLYCWEMIFADLAIGIFIMRLMILGLKINEKYRSNLSILITEQINLYLQQEQKPHKKEELTLANHVLKLAADLLKQLESPFKISGFSANPYLYNMTKVVVLSAFSAVLSELLGFKLKLHKIKITS